MKKPDVYALYRNDFYYYLLRAFKILSPGKSIDQNWHIRAMAYALAQCYLGETRRLIVTVPPRYLKSYCAVIAYVSWVLGKDPTKRIICASYGQELATHHSLDCRRVMQSQLYRTIFPGTKLDGQKLTQDEFYTTQGGGRYATGLGGTLTGLGGDVFIIDDPMKAADADSDAALAKVIDYYKNSVITRLDGKKDACIILVMQRLHEYDLAGFLLENGDFVHLNLPAVAEADEEIPIGPGQSHRRKVGELLHPAREPQPVLDELKKSMGVYLFEAQYQQRPVPVGGGLFQWEWVQSYYHLPQLDTGQIVQSWDIASEVGDSNDWSVGTTWFERDGNHWLLDLVRVRMPFPELKNLVYREALRHRAHAVLIEAAMAGIPMIQELNARTALRIIPIKPREDKITRAKAASLLLQSGKVKIPAEADWLGEFRHEMMKFPRGQHDDIVDSVTQYLNWVRKTGYGSPQWEVNVELITRGPSVSAGSLLDLDLQ